MASVHTPHQGTSGAVDWIREFAFRMGGRQACCGATNAPCPRPPGVVYQTPTGCEHCGHPTSCHAKAWSR